MKIKDNIVLRSDIPEYLTQRGVVLHKSGREYRCACPIHNGERTDTFCCTSKKWYCFGCCEGGAIVELHMALNGTSFMQAIYEEKQKPTPSQAFIRYCEDRMAALSELQSELNPSDLDTIERILSKEAPFFKV